MAGDQRVGHRRRGGVTDDGGSPGHDRWGTGGLLDPEGIKDGSEVPPGGTLR